MDTPSAGLPSVVSRMLSGDLAHALSSFSSRSLVNLVLFAHAVNLYFIRRAVKCNLACNSASISSAGLPVAHTIKI